MAFTYGTVRKCTTADGSASNVYEVRLGYELQSQDLINNTSVIKLQLQARSTSSSYKPYGYSQTSHIDGIDFGSKTYDFRSTNTWQTFATTSNITVYHNADGTYNVEKSGYFTSSVSGARPKRGDASVNVVLPTIPRASSITVNDANIGSSTSIIINKAIDSFTTTLWYKAFDENDWTKIVDKTNLQAYGWTVPTSFYQKIPNNKTLYCEFKADTYNGDTYVGTSNVVGATFTATGSPIINSISGEDINSTTVALTGDSLKMIRYASLVRVSVNATAQNSAWISSIYVNNQQANNGVVDFYNADTNNYQVVVNDSRGYQSYYTFTMQMVDYVPLTLNANIKRNQPTDGKVNINLSGNWFNGNFGNRSNTLEVRYRYKEYGAGTWEQDWTATGLTGSIDGNNWSVTGQLSGMTYTKSYQFEVKAYDEIQEKNVTGITVTKGEPVYWWDNDEFDVNSLFKVKTIDNNNQAIHIKAGNRNEASINYFNANSTKNYVAGYGTYGYDGFGIYSGETDKNIITLDKDGNTNISGICHVNGEISTNYGIANYGGSIEMFGQTPYIDFHYNSSSSDYTSRIIEADSGMLYIPYNFKIEGQLRRKSEAYTSGTIDFDNLILEGYYQVATSVTNGPSSNVDGILEVKKLYINDRASFTIQELFDYNVQKWYKRVKWYDIFWTNWIALN